MSKKILIVEDDKKTAVLLRIYLEKDGFNVYMSHDGRDGLDQARQTNPDLVVLDLMLPKIDGLDVCRILRAESETPIIMLTALSTEDDILLGLDLGADDYITKPFSPREVVARVRSVLRRSGNDLPKPVKEFKYKELAIDFMGHETRMKGKKINLTPKEFNLLETLVQHPGRAFSRQELIAAAFGHNYSGLERTIDVHVMNLRKKIEPDPDQPIYVQTVYGIGYKFGEGKHAP